jgi:uncharacterized protein YebE (UPF0316 family)
VTLGLDTVTLLTGLGVFCARVVDVSLGTMRTIAIVQGRTLTAFFLGFFEVGLWLGIISTIIPQIGANPILILFYALGFSTGNVVGIKLEGQLAQGHVILRVITACNGPAMAEALRAAGHAVTAFSGQGRSGPVTELLIVCRRRDLRKILPLVQCLEPGVFYVTEPAGVVSKVYRSVTEPLTGWRAILKKK